MASADLQAGNLKEQVVKNWHPWLGQRENHNYVFSQHGISLCYRLLYGAIEMTLGKCLMSHGTLSIVVRIAG